MATVMVVDDSATIRMSLKIMLERYGFTVLLADNGNDALRKLADGTPPGALITDLNMPGMGGLDLVRAIRRDPRLRFTPTFLLTTESDQQRRAELKAAGATGWLVKPIKGADLIAVLEQGARLSAMA